MSTSVKTFVDYLLNVETTSDEIFDEKIDRNHQLYRENHLPQFEQIIENKLKHWRDFDQKEESAIVDGSRGKPKTEAGDDDSSDEWEEDKFTDDRQEAAVQSFEEIQVRLLFQFPDRKSYLHIITGARTS